MLALCGPYADRDPIIRLYFLTCMHGIVVLVDLGAAGANVEAKARNGTKPYISPFETTYQALHLAV